MTPLLRYWLFPGRLRRLPVWGRVLLAALLALLTLGVSIAILRLKGRFWFAPGMGFWIVLFIALPGGLSVLGAFSGASLIAGERQKQTWETLLLTTLSVGKIAVLKLAARLTFCLLLALPFTIWFVCAAYRVMKEGGLASTDGDPSASVLRVRTAVFLAWTFLQVICHLFPFVTLGMAVSARCRKVNDALLVCAGILTGYGVVFWLLVTTWHAGSILNSGDPGLAAVVFRWPVLPYLSGYYQSSKAIVTAGWGNNIAADLIWTVAVPAVFLPLAISWSRLSRRTPDRRKVTDGG